MRDPEIPFSEADRAALTEALAATGPEGLERHREALVRAGSHYLLHVKRGGGSASDPVAHFHLSNGARVERVNWPADLSAPGFQASLGMMVNYLYRSGDLLENQQAYAAGEVAASSPVAQAAQLERR